MKRNAFSMIFAVILTVLIATLGILGLRLSTSTLNTTTNEHIAIQLELYANSTAELAILYIQRYGFVYAQNDNDRTRKVSNVMQPIERYINYGPNGEYKFKYKMTPLINNDRLDTNVYDQNDPPSDPNKLQFREDQKGTMVLDISGYVINPMTSQQLRITRRQIVKP